MNIQLLPLNAKSFSDFPSAHRQWRMRTTFLFGLSIILFTSTGCSTITNFFGSTKISAAELESAPPRILMPTPVREGATANAVTTTNVGPTPTPFVMRPRLTTAAQPTVAEETSSVQATRPVLHATILGDSVNIRNSPGLEGQILTSVPQGTEFDYVDENKDGDWVQICCVEEQLAWVYSPLVRISPGGTDQIFTGQNEGTTESNNRSQGQVISASTSALAASSFAATTFTAAEDDFTLTLPPGWSALVTTDGLNDERLATVASDNPQLSTLMERQLATVLDLPVALVAFDLAPAAVSSGFANNVTIMKQPIPAGFPLAYVVQLNVDQLESVLGLSAATTSTELALPAGDAIMLIHESDGQSATRQYYLLHNQVLYVITFTINAAQVEEGNVLFAEIMQSFKFVK